MKKKLLTSVLLIFWIFGVGIFLHSKANFSLKPGKSSEFQEIFPSDSRIEVARDRYNLVVFIHPKCSCSAATVENLRTMLSSNPSIVERAKIHVVLFSPESAPEGWLDSDLVTEINTLKSQFVISIFIDKEMTEFNRFKAHTSGQAFLFAPKGGLVFKGGLTDERAHSGPAKGIEAITNLLIQSKPRIATLQSSTPVFGCETE